MAALFRRKRLDANESAGKTELNEYVAAACVALEKGGFSASENWLKECFSQAAAQRNRHKQKKRKQQQQKRQKRPRHNPTVGGGVTVGSVL